MRSAATATSWSAVIAPYWNADAPLSPTRCDNSEAFKKLTQSGRISRRRTRNREKIMAPLSDSELRKILGANYLSDREAIDAANGVTSRERTLKADIENVESTKSLAGFSSLIGVALIIASIFSVKGTTLLIQTGAGAAIVALALLVFIVCRNSINKKRTALAALRA